MGGGHRRRCLRSVSRALAIALLARPAAAEDPEPAPEAAPGEPPSHRVDFEADRVDVDGELQELELSGDVVVVADRYRVTSDRVRLVRTPRGILVDGDGRVALCPCPSSPVTIGFTSATVAPPTDLLIEQPTVRVGGVPVLWLPYLWLRSSDRLGVLPPKVQWRGEDGLLLGSGVHVPLGSRESRAIVDLSGAAYLKGGFQLETRVVTRRASSRVRWDRLDDDLVALDAAGSSTPIAGGALAWRVDALRGPRGRRGTVELEPAARRYDRAELGAVVATGATVVGVGAGATDDRGGSLEEVGAVGPRAHVGAGTALGDVGVADISLAARSFDHPLLGSASVVQQRGELGVSGRPGPLATELGLRQRGTFASNERDDRTSAAAAGRASLSLPLSRRFGGRLTHWVEPFLEGGGGVAEEQGTLPDARLRPAPDFHSAAVGLTTSLGDYVARSAAELTLRAGTIGDADDSDPAFAGRLGADSRWIGLSADAAAVGLDDQRAVLASRARLGASAGPHLRAYAAGRHRATPARARLVTRGGWDEPRSGWFDRAGWTGGGEVRVPWTSWLASAVAADYDLTADELLSVRGSVGYRHPCGCLAALAWSGTRLGRDGVDAWLTLDLLP